LIDPRLWNVSAAPFSGDYRIVLYDAENADTAVDVPPGPTRSRSSGDALAILDAETIADAHVCGLSLGGITALWLAVHAPDRVRSLVMANTGARIGSVEFWDARMALVRERGMAAVADVAIPNWFTDGFRAREPARCSSSATTSSPRRSRAIWAAARPCATRTCASR
jgi:3-oxoadipate enol-lactonase